MPPLVICSGMILDLCHSMCQYFQKVYVKNLKYCSLSLWHLKLVQSHIDIRTNFFLRCVELWQIFTPDCSKYPANNCHHTINVIHSLTFLVWQVGVNRLTSYTTASTNSRTEYQVLQVPSTFQLIFMPNWNNGKSCLKGRKILVKTIFFWRVWAVYIICVV